MSKKPNPLKETFKFVADVLRNAVNLEWKTDAGRVNIVGMVLSFAVVLIMLLFNTAEILLGFLAALAAKESLPMGPSAVDVVWVFMAFTLLCVAMLGVLVLRSRRDDKTSDK